MKTSPLNIFLILCAIGISIGVVVFSFLTTIQASAPKAIEIPPGEFARTEDEAERR